MMLRILGAALVPSALLAVAQCFLTVELICRLVRALGGVAP